MWIFNRVSIGLFSTGGFLAQLVKKQSIDKCVDCGIWASGIIIQCSGCEYPAHISYDDVYTTDVKKNRNKLYFDLWYSNQTEIEELGTRI